MDKISSIIPASHRVTQVDLDESPPVRRGVPGFGQRETPPSDRQDTFTKMSSSVEPGLNTYKELNQWKDHERMRANQARHISDQFFMKPKMESQNAPEIMSSYTKPSDFESRPSVNSIGSNKLNALTNRDLGRRAYFVAPIELSELEVRGDLRPYTLNLTSSTSPSANVGSIESP